MLEIIKPRDYFNKNVPDDAQKEILRLIFKGYRTPYDEIMQSDYKQRLGMDLFPNARRAKIDSYLLQLPKLVPDAISKIRSNARRNSHHAVIYCGNVFMTASAVQHESDLPRLAIFRQVYASMQSEFDYSESDNTLKIINISISTEPKLYALILHGPDIGNDKWLPGFVKIVFPGKDCKSRMDDDIDLYAKYPYVVQEQLMVGTEQVKDGIELTLKVEIPEQEKLL